MTMLLQQARLPFDEPVTGIENDVWAVRRSARARRLSVRVFHSGRVEIVAPLRAADSRIREFLLQHREWVERQRLRSRERTPTVAAVPFPPDRLHLAAFDESWRVHVGAGAGPARIVSLGQGVLSLKGHGGDAPQIRAALIRWLVSHVRRHFSRDFAALSQAAGLHFDRIDIRRQRTRWGSCSARRTISLNLCLAFQRPEVVRYLMIHELTHLEHMNHSAQFWRRVAERCPDWQRLDHELLDGWRRVPHWVFR